MRKIIVLLCLYGVVINSVFDWMEQELQEEVKKLADKYRK